jgi:hypothetical protein
MIQLQDVVLNVVKDFVKNEVLFTGLDVSNEVKKTLPFAKHKDVRDLVRAAWQSDISPQNYDRTPIKVVLVDGTVADALLYHPLSASWDLDNLYTQQQRSQTLNKVGVTQTAPVTVAPVTSVSGTLSKADDGTLTVVTAPVNPLSITAAPAVNPRDLWAQMWQNQPSLFPRK